MNKPLSKQLHIILIVLGILCSAILFYKVYKDQPHSTPTPVSKEWIARMKQELIDRPPFGKIKK